MPANLNTYSISAITNAVQPLLNEQPDSIVTQLLTSSDRTIAADTLNATMSSLFPDAAPLISDPQEREIRRDRSDLAWQTMLLQVTTNAAVSRPAETKPYLSMLFHPESGPDGIAFNDDLRKAIQENNTQTLATMYDDHLQALEPYTAEELQDLTDDQLVENFSKLYALYMAAQSAAQLLAAGNTDEMYSLLSGDSAELVKTLVKDLAMFAALISRFEMICHPYYEQVDTEALMADSSISRKATTALTTLEKDSKDAWFFQQAQTRADHAFDLQLVRQLQNSDFDFSSAKIYDLSQKEYHLNTATGNRCGEAFRQGKALVCRDAQGHVIALRPDKEGFVETNPKVLLSDAVHATLSAQVAALTELATGSVADPFWLLTGSSQYRDIKNALTAHAQLMQTIGDPPREEELGPLFRSLEQLSHAADQYLNSKDPSITKDMTFQRYMQEKGNALGLNEREKARLEAAFKSRELARQTHDTVSLSRNMGYKNEQILSADHIFYQGLIRKHAQLEQKLDGYMLDPKNTAAAAQIDRIMSDPKFYSSDYRIRPAGMSELETVLWEMQRVTELMDDAETLMGLRPQARTLDKKEAARINSSKKFKEQDPAEMSVEQLQNQLYSKMQDQAMKNAQARAKSIPEPQPEPQPQMQMQPAEAAAPSRAPRSAVINPDNPFEMNYYAKSSEFVEDQALFESELLRCNSSAEVRNHLQEHPQMRKDTKRHLEHRANCLEVIEELEENTTYHPPLSRYTVYKDGEEVNKEPEIGDTIMLHGVHERRSQSTWNGCWSVSLVSQLEYRGVKLPQEVVRSYRPGEEEGDVDAEDYYKDRKQAVASFSGLTARLMPNAILMQTALVPKTGAEKNKELMRHIIFNALTKCNSPVSLCAGGHYLTVVGMGQDCVYVKNPMHFFGSDPEKVEMWTLDDLIKKGRGSIEMNWFHDVKPSLGGSIEEGAEWSKDGVFYGNGRAHSSYRDEINDPVKPHERVVQSKFVARIPGQAFDGEAPGYQVCMFKPVNLRYKRIPGSQYNADALEKMQDELLDYYNDEQLLIPNEVKLTLQEASKLRRGDYKDNPHEGMLNLAGKYLDAMDKMKQLHPGLADPEKEQPKENVKNLYNTLTNQLGQIRKAVMDMQQADYKVKIGGKDIEMTYGNEEKRNEKSLNANQYNERRKLYFGFREGFAGALYYHVANSFELEDRQWIQYLKPDTAKNEIQKIEQGEAINTMITDMYDIAKKYTYYTGDSYYNYKAFLQNKLGQPAYDRFGERVTKFNKYPSLDNASEAEIRERLNALETEKEQVYKDANLNPEHYDKMPAKYSTQRMKDRCRLTCFEKLRLDVRSGNTEGVYNHYLQYEQKIAQKNAQPVQQPIHQNAVPEKEQQNPEMKNIPKA